MPQLELFNRRWRIATDTMPLFAAFLAIVHIIFLIPVVTLAAETEGGAYTCNQKIMVQTSAFGILAVYVLSLLLEFCIVFIGLRGGPLEERKRRAMKPVVFLQFMLWVFVFALTILATYIASSPKIADTCWSNNPCQTIRDVVPSACTYDQNGDIQLTPACADVVTNGEYFTEVCWPQWFDYAATWSVTNYNASMDPPFNPPRGESSCNKSIALNSKQFHAFADTHIFPTVEFTAEEAQNITRFSSTVESSILGSLGIPHQSQTAGGDSPWFHCFDPRCQGLIKSGDACDYWDVLVAIPDSTNRKRLFLATLIASWIILAISALVVYFAFNAWPYDDSESWEKSVRSVSKLCCCSNVLDVAQTEMGQSATKEIGNILYFLFGGVDLDPTDQVLGMYLVAERQRWRRRRHIVAALKEAGISTTPAKQAFMRRMCAKLLPSWCLNGPRQLPEATRRHLPMLGHSTRVNSILLTSTLERAGLPEEETAPPDAIPVTLPVSPFENVPARQNDSGPGPPGGPNSVGTDLGVHSGRPPSAATPKRRPGFSRDSSIAYQPPEMVQSFVRLVSVQSRDSRLPQLSQEGQLSSVSAEAQTTQGGAAALSGVPPQPVGARRAMQKSLIVADRPQPMITPVDLKKLGIYGIPLTSYAAAKMYIGQNYTRVEPSELEEILQMSYFAQSSYGLQTVRWRMAASGSVITDTLDRVLATKCCSLFRKPLGLDSRFRKRNFQAILKLTGVSPGDLLYVSYTSAAFGVLPYLVMLHHATRSVVVSVRGTVGFEDLITDLLSSPVDASEGMPDWVLNEAAAMSADALQRTKESVDDTNNNNSNNASPEDGRDSKDSMVADEGLFAHAGILSSSLAVLRDLKTNGLLEAMLDVQRGGGEGGQLPGRDQQTATATATKKNKANQRSNHSSFGNGTNDTNARPPATDERLGDLGAEEMMERLQTLNDDDDVGLSLDRAKSVVNEAVAGLGWRVVVTGHSLGAAVACMLSFHLKQYFPSLRCFAFCPPGGLISAPLSRMARQFCTSIIVGSDAISRLSLVTARLAVDDMVLALARCKRQKLAVLADILIGRRKDPATAPPTFCAFEDVGEEAMDALQKYVATSKLHVLGLDMRELYPPGRIIHLRPYSVEGVKKGPEAEAWDAVRVGAEDVIGEGLLISSAMMRHHRMPCLHYALRSAIKQEAFEQARAAQEQGPDPVNVMNRV